MENIFEVANEAYQGDSNVKGLKKYLDDAKKYYLADKKEQAFRILKEMCADIKKVFNFRDVSINLNDTTSGPFMYGEHVTNGATYSICHITLTQGTVKTITPKDIEIMNKTYRFKEPIVSCNLSIYGPRMLGDDLFNTSELLALIVREIGYSFYSWTSGKKVLNEIGTAIEVANAACQSYEDKSAVPLFCAAVDVAPKYIKDISISSDGPTKSRFAKVWDKVTNIIATPFILLLTPIIGAINILSLPFQLIFEAMNKSFGINYDEADKFADQFAASYGYGAELASAMKKMKYTGAFNKSFNNFMNLYAEVFCLSSLAYTATSSNVECVNTGAALPRIESMIQYYENELVHCRNNKEISKEIREKLKMLTKEYDILSKLPRENYTPSAIVAKLWTKLFGTDTAAMDRLDEVVRVNRSSKKK